MQRSSKLHFHGLTIDLSRGVLVRGVTQLPLRRQSFEVMRYLAERAGSTVSSDDLIAAIWTARPADPNESVGQCIREIRQAIGSDARWIIKTVTGKGYQLAGDVMLDEPALSTLGGASGVTWDPKEPAVSRWWWPPPRHQRAAALIAVLATLLFGVLSFDLLSRRP